MRTKFCQGSFFVGFATQVVLTVPDENDVPDHGCLCFLFFLWRNLPLAFTVLNWFY